MPEVGIFAVRDIKSDAFRPFFHPTIASAIRTFATLCQDNTSDIGRYPEDFQLLHCGFFDESTGEVRTVPISYLSQGTDHVKPTAQSSGAENSSLMKLDLAAAHR